MAIEQEKLQKILQRNFPNAEITIVDLAGDSDHYSVTIKDQIFAGKTRIAQHKIVNETLKGILGDQLHAMQLKTLSQ